MSAGNVKRETTATSWAVASQIAAGWSRSLKAAKDEISWMRRRSDARQGGSQGEEDARSGGPLSNSANPKTGLGKPSPVAQIRSPTKMAAVRGFRMGSLSTEGTTWWNPPAGPLLTSIVAITSHDRIEQERRQGEVEDEGVYPSDARFVEEPEAHRAVAAEDLSKVRPRCVEYRPQGPPILTS